MFKRLRFISLILCSLTLLLGGCATNRGVVSLSLPASEKPAESNGKEIYISSVRDQREFQINPRSADIPSLDPTEDQGDNIKLRAVARKRNGFGKGLGDIVLKEGQTVESLVRDSLMQALSENGFKVIDKKTDVTDQTYVLDVKIIKFWSWMNPGFFALSLSTEISTPVTMKQSAHTSETVISVKASDNFQTGAEDNWISVMQSALKAYIAEAKSKIK